jgi:FkbM family methyltransferase
MGVSSPVVISMDEGPTLVSNFLCPPSMMPDCAKILAGEYDIPGLSIKHATILDIGANVGSFAIWAAWRFPDSSITCYEPHPENFEMLRANLSNHHVHAQLEEKAVWVQEGRAFLYDGHHNCGEASLYPTPGHTKSTGHEVSTIPASTLPRADILKIDTEGAELSILVNYPFVGLARAIMLEWHSHEDRYQIGSFLIERGFHFHTDNHWAPVRGIQKWVRDGN